MPTSSLLGRTSLWAVYEPGFSRSRALRAAAGLDVAVVVVVVVAVVVVVQRAGGEGVAICIVARSAPRIWRHLIDRRAGRRDHSIVAIVIYICMGGGVRMLGREEGREQAAG